MVELIGECSELQNGNLILDEIGTRTEYDTAKTILIDTHHRTELFIDILHPNAILFLSLFDPINTVSEYQNFIDILENDGANVINIRNALLTHINNKNVSILTQLKDLTKSSFRYIKNEKDNFFFK